MPLTEEQWTRLADDLRRSLTHVAPEWTDTNAHDPGITVLQVLCYLITDLRYRDRALDEGARELARILSERARSLAEPPTGDANDDCGQGLQRVNYFAGRVLGLDDFTAEQRYLIARLRRRNRFLRGSGVVSGLGVTVEDAPGGSCVTIGPGLAFDPMGNEICVESPFQIPLPAEGPDILVVLRYAERPCRMAPALAGMTVDMSDDLSSSQPTRIVETFNAELSDAPDGDSVPIARLRQAHTRWHVDPHFQAVTCR